MLVTESTAAVVDFS
jgi:hypothetical protein